MRVRRVRATASAPSTWVDPLLPIARQLFMSRVRYCAIGGVAVSCFDASRVPTDFDFVVSPKQQNAERLERALTTLIVRYSSRQEDADPPYFDAEYIAAGGELILRLPVGKLHLVGESLPDIIDPDRLVDRRRWWLAGRTPIACCSLSDLIAIKSAVGAPRDVSDVAALRRLLSVDAADAADDA